MECKERKPCGLHCIKINDINITLGKEQILKNINIHVHCGELTVLIGPNGAGKSTLLKALLGEIKHTGNVVYTDLKNNTTQEIKMGYVPQKIEIERDIPITVYDMFASYISNYPIWFKKSSKLYKKIYDRLKIFSIEDCIDKQVGKLSGGELQRVLLSIAITPIPDLLILDEPVSGIDRNGIRDFYKILDDMKQNYDMSIILVSHDLDLVSKYADKVILLNGEILCEGTPLEVFNNKKFKDIFE